MREKIELLNRLLSFRVQANLFASVSVLGYFAWGAQECGLLLLASIACGVLSLKEGE